MNIDKQVSAMKPTRFTTAQAATLVGKSKDTLKRWRTNGVVVPSDVAVFGATVVPLYTKADITKLQSTAQVMRPGRKKKEEAKQDGEAADG